MNPNHFFILGAAKCGTTTLFASLRQHPKIQSAIDPQTGRPIKELDFFDRQWQHGFDWYQRFFPVGQQRTFDSSPNYLCNPAAFPRISRRFPQAKVIVTLRDPVERAVSHHNHYTQVMPASRTWDWRRPGDDLNGCLRAEIDQPWPRWKGIIGRGRYVEQLEELTRYIPRHRLHVMIMEEWTRDAGAAMRQIYQFLELDPIDTPVVVSHQRPHTTDRLPDSMMGQLVDLYRKPNERLFQWLGREVTAWAS